MFSVVLLSCSDTVVCNLGDAARFPGGALSETQNRQMAPQRLTALQ